MKMLLRSTGVIFAETKISSGMVVVNPTLFIIFISVNNEGVMIKKMGETKV